MSRKCLQNVYWDICPLQALQQSLIPNFPLICTRFFICLLDIWKGKRKSYDCSYKKKRDIFLFIWDSIVIIGGHEKKNFNYWAGSSKKILGFAKNSRVVFWHKNQNNHVHNSIDVAIFQKRNVNSKMKSVRNWQYTVISPTPSQNHNITTTYASGKQFPALK